jgi:hypothetical protein
MRARLISTDGEYLEARIDIDGTVLHVMDQFSPAECGDVLDIELFPMLDEHESNNDILDGNPERIRGLERIEGWSYRAFGIIRSLSPVTVDCGQIRIEDDDFEATGSGIGQAVAFTISRLSAQPRMQAAKAAPAAPLPVGIDDATAATYHDLGFRLDLFDEHFIKEWAYKIIGERDTPPIPIIEIATAANRDALCNALSIARERGHLLAATRLLLGHIARELAARRISTRSAIRAAMTLCNDDSLDDAAYIDFMRFNEDIYINEYAGNRSDEDMRSEALRLLAEHARPQETPPRDYM